MENLEFKIRGMDCAEEIDVLRREIGPLVGGENRLRFDILRGKMAVESPSVSADEIIRAVNKTGMQAGPWCETGKRSEKRDGIKAFRNGRTVAMALSGLLTLVGFVLHSAVRGGLAEALGSEGLGRAHDVPLVARVVYLMAILVGGWYVAPKAFLALRRLRPDMNLLMTIAVIGAALIGEWLEAALVTFLFALSLALEAWSVGRARRAVEALLDLAPPMVRVLSDGGETEVPADRVPLGEIFLVKPGDRIALDGEVLRGSSEVNQAPITGESVPVPKEPGTQVFAGTINGDGALEVRSTKLASDTTLAHIIQMVGAAQANKAPSEQWVEKFARYYTPIVFAFARRVSRPAATAGWHLAGVDLPRAGVAGNRMSLRSCYFDSCQHCRRARCICTKRCADQGRSLRRSAGAAEGHSNGQNGNTDGGSASGELRCFRSPACPSRSFLRSPRRWNRRAIIHWRAPSSNTARQKEFAHG